MLVRIKVGSIEKKILYFKVFINKNSRIDVKLDVGS